jgi:predicted extracellular nuclease
LVIKKSAPAPVTENLTPAPQASSPSAQGESGSPVPAKSSSEEKSESGSSSSEKSSSVQPSGGSSSGLGDDVVAIKSLLAQIATNLSGPLNIYNPDPFRPDSRRI